MYLFSKTLLNDLLSPEDFSLAEHSELIKEIESERCVVRPLHNEDYLKGYFDLISEDDYGNPGKKLSKHEEKQRFEEYFSALTANKDTNYIVVYEDKQTHRILGAGTMSIEQKFIHSASKRGRVIDVKISQPYQRKGLGSLLLEVLTLLSKRLGCYKSTLIVPLNMQKAAGNVKYIAESNQNHCRHDLQDETIMGLNVENTLPAAKI